MPNEQHQPSNNLLGRLVQLEQAANQQIGSGASQTSLLAGKRLGLEKESLRVSEDGLIAQSDHPAAMGSALCNSIVTTDYSEALLELVTPAMKSASDAYRFLGQTHRFVYQHLPEGESIWNTSMPCALDGAEKIRIGYYGSSNNGMMKAVYRRGLGLRYGKVMQTIAGVHYNYSWPATLWQALATTYTATDNATEPSRDVRALAADFLNISAADANAGGAVAHSTKGAASHPFVSDQYMAATRNLLRDGWLVPLLFGASPAICRTFLEGGEPLPGMQLHNNHTFYEPYATSLRMGDIGYNYKRDAAATIQVDYSSLQSYTSDLHRLITTPHPSYVGDGIKDDRGEYQQLNHNVLQIENEYYSSVRPKQLTLDHEPPVHAMQRRGIMYLELRSLDVNMFEPVGMSLEQLHFLEVFMLHALLKDSPPISDDEMNRLAENRKNVAHHGRDPELKLQSSTGSRPLKDCALELMDELEEVAQFLDRDAGGAGASSQEQSVYSASVAAQREKINDLSKTPSAQMLELMFSGNISYFELAREYSERARSACEKFEEDSNHWSKLVESVPASLAKQQEIEAGDDIGFEEFLAKYEAQLDADS